MSDLGQLAKQIRRWQWATFPSATLDGAVNHLAREALELQRAPTDGEEMADIFFMLIQAADLAGVDLSTEVAKKLAKNERRTWKPADQDGVYEHASEG